jgi:tetratricopeptide (TPR) repeat protein
MERTMVTCIGPARGRRLWQGVLFRVLAVSLGLLPLLACEAVLRAFDLGRSSAQVDPFVGFSAVRPLFERNREGTRYEISRAHEKFFRPDGFAAVKPRDEFRIFCLGGSTVQGRPYAIETSFTTWLELSLRAADPSRRWRVVNCGGVSYATYREAIVVQELLGYQPDLFILCTGHNEFLEDRSYAHLKQAPALVRGPLEQASRLRTFSILGGSFAHFLGDRGPRIPEDRPMLGTEVEAVLDYEGGLASYHRNEAWRQGVIDHFRFNLRRMVEMAHRAGVPVILMNPVSNLDTPPFKSEHRAGMSADEIRRFDQLWTEARQLYQRSLPEAVRRLERAIELDDQHAGIHYTLAKCYQDLGRMDDARAEFLRARDLDICPLRILGPMNRAVLDIARATRSPVIDLVAFFAKKSRGGITGYDWLVDHVHPSIQGHQLIADLLADEMVRLGYVHPRPDWIAERDRLYRENLESLDDLYYLMGQKRLGNLLLWAQGRGNRVRESAAASQAPLAPARPIGGPAPAPPAAR